MTDRTNRYYLTAKTAKCLLQALNEKHTTVSVSLDLNLSIQTVRVDGTQVHVDGDNTLTQAQLSALTKQETRVWMLAGNALSCVERRGSHYYKLVPTSGAPTLEINGVKMHRSKDMDPFHDAESKARVAVRQGDRILDTCSGLGYTAIWAAKLGAREVLSIEFDALVRDIRQDNPWSWGLLDPRIRLDYGDSGDYINQLENDSFQGIVHDPPRFSMAGNLYGQIFYAELLRVLSRGGRLFHYTGNPYVVRRGRTFIAQVAARLKHVGFRNVQIMDKLLGVKAQR